MKPSSIACFLGIIPFLGAGAFAAPPSAVTSVNPSVFNVNIPDCATGFNKSGAVGSPTSAPYGWNCSTPTIVCPSAPSGMDGGMVNWKADKVGKGVRFSYTCSYMVPPR
jgi:hypothetical protein